MCQPVKFFVKDNNIYLELIGSIPDNPDYFISLYNKAVSMVDTNECTFSIDCIRLETPNWKSMKKVMEPCFNLYKLTKFKKINLIVVKAQKCFKKNMEDLKNQVQLDNMDVIVTDNLNGIFDKKLPYIKDTFLHQ